MVIRIIIVTAAVLVAAVATNVLTAGEQGNAMTDKRTILETSDNPRDLMRTALVWTQGTDTAELYTLYNFLSSQNFLDRLDSADDYAAAASNKLRVARLVESLARNQAPAARETFDALLRAPVFTANEDRIEVLIRASEFVRPPTPSLVPFWKTYSQPDDGYVHLTVTALLCNGSEPALGVFAQLLTNTDHEEGYKLAWLRSDLLAHRDDVRVLRMSDKLLQGGLPEPLERSLLEVLFNYRPGEWYRPANPSSPPDRALAQPDALHLLRDIGGAGLGRLPDDDPLRATVEAELESIDARLTGGDSQ